MNWTNSFNHKAIPAGTTLDEKIQRIHEQLDDDDCYYNERESTDNDDDDIFNDD